MSTFTIKLSGEPTGRREYACDAHGPFDLVVDLATSRDPRPCPACGAPSERTLEQRIVTRMAICVESGTGKSDAPPTPFAMDSRKIFEQGQSVAEWRAERRKVRRDYERDQARQRGVRR